MIEQLFGSKTRVKLLKLFTSNPNRSFYVREMTRKIDEQINSVRRELSNLLSIGIIKSDSSNNKLYYEVDQTFEHFDALASMFGGRPLPKQKSAPAKKAAPKKKPELKESAPKTEPAPAVVTSEEKALGNVDLVVLGGAFTRDSRSPVEVLIVGDVTPSALDNYISDLEGSLGDEIRFAVFTTEEFTYRMQIKDRFIVTMLSSKLTVKVDKNDVMTSFKE